MLAAVGNGLNASPNTPREAYVPPGPRARLARSFREAGVPATLRSSLAWAVRFAAGPAVAKRLRGEAGFSLGAESFRYEDSWHNWTWLNERSVEVPIAAAALRQTPPGSAIEVGAVMQHYGHSGHRVIDKYESGPGIEQLDIFDIAPEPSYQLVLSVSTLEHVGWDEPKRDPDLALHAIAHLKRLVAPGGALMVTVPAGYHPTLDSAIRNGTIEFSSVRALRCEYPSMVWDEVAAESTSGAKYDELIYRAEAVLICCWVNNASV